MVFILQRITTAAPSKLFLSKVINQQSTQRSISAFCHCRSDYYYGSSNTTTATTATAMSGTTTTSRNYHQSTLTMFESTIADDDTLKSPKEPRPPGSKAFMLESDRHALVDLFKKHATPEHPRCLDRKALGLVLKAVGESPDEETLEKLFQDADLDGNGVIDLEEFLTSSDKILGSAPAGMVLLVGGPGSGKGVLSERLVKECGIVHISSGDLLREEVDRDTPLGREVKEIMVRGDLVSSAVIVTLMRRKMRQPQNAGKRVLLDGFPRSLQNAADLVEVCGEPELALHLRCDDTVLIERILHRKEEALLDDQNGGGRDDDNIKTALKRLRNYHKYLHVTMDWLSGNKVPVVNLDCSGPPEQVWGQLVAIGQLMRPACTINEDDLSIGSDDLSWLADSNKKRDK
jgi:adenylate kinase